MYSVELRRRVPDRRPVAGAQDRQVERAQALERGQVLAEPAGDEHAALAEHGVAGEAGAAGDEREVVVGVAGDRDRPQRPELVAVGERHVGRVPRGRDRDRAQPLAQRLDALAVVGVVVRERDPAGAAAARDLRGDRVEVGGERRAGIDHPRRVAPDDPRVRAVERVRARVVGPQARDPVVGEVAHRRRALP